MNGVLTQATATNTSGIGGADNIEGGDGNDLILGGANTDTIFGNSGNDLIFGDFGQILLSNGLIVSATTTELAIGGGDLVDGGDGDDTIFGGAGDDRLNGGKGADVIVGDLGKEAFSLGLMVSVETITAGSVGNDLIQGDAGNDLILGGGGSDTIGGGDGDDTLVGDSGRATWSRGFLQSVIVLDPATGAGDVIDGGTGNDLIVGGAGRDKLTGGDGRDVLVGDGVEVTYDFGAIVLVEATDSLYGDADSIDGERDDDLIIGGLGSDLLKGNSGNDVIIGDLATVSLFNNQATLVTTADRSNVGADTIDGGIGDDVLLGGSGRDILIGDYGQDILIGDGGTVSFVVGRPTKLTTTPGMGADADTFDGGIGDDLIIGGGGADFMNGAEGNDILVGDDATATWLGGFLASLATINPNSGGADIILGGPGDDLALGGAGNDQIFGEAGRDVLLGDGGHFEFVQGRFARATTTDPTLGGIDTISGGDNDDAIFGGAGGDNLWGDGGNDSIGGDFGTITASSGGFTLVTTNPTLGGNDTIDGGDGNDFLAGGFGDDLISGGLGNDRIFGDSSQTVVTTTATTTSLAPGVGGNDTLNGGPGDDIIRGGFGNDLIIGGPGNDDLDGGTGSLADPTGQDTLLDDSGTNQMRYDYADGFAQGLNVATMKFLLNTDFNDNTMGRFAKTLGSWSVSNGAANGVATTNGALSIWPLNAASNSFDIRATINTRGSAGIVFDYQNTSSYRFVVVVAGANQIILGRRTAAGFVTDLTLSRAIRSGGDTVLGLSVRGRSLGIYLDRQLVTTQILSAPVVSGQSGLFVRTGTATFDQVMIPRREHPLVGNPVEQPLIPDLGNDHQARHAEWTGRGSHDHHGSGTSRRHGDRLPPGKLASDDGGQIEFAGVRDRADADDSRRRRSLGPATGWLGRSRPAGAQRRDVKSGLVGGCSDDHLQHRVGPPAGRGHRPHGSGNPHDFQQGGSSWNTPLHPAENRDSSNDQPRGQRRLPPFAPDRPTDPGRPRRGQSSGYPASAHHIAGLNQGHQGATRMGRHQSGLVAQKTTSSD